MIIQDLIEKSINGDTNACEKLIKHFDKAITNYTLKVTKNNYELAEDISQQARIKIFKSIKNFRGDSNFATWMYCIIRNTYIDYIRKIKNNNVSLEEYIEKFADDHTPILINNCNILEDLIIDEQKNMIKNLVNNTLKTLPQSSMDILNQFYFENKTYDEISKTLKVPEGTVKSRLYRAKMIFADKAKKQYNLITAG